MKKIMFGIFLGCTLTALAFADTQKGSSVAVNSALDEESRVGGWDASLDGIENSTAILMNTNRKLLEEYQSLVAGIAVLESGIAPQRQKNQELAAALDGRRKELGTRLDTTDIRRKITMAEKDAQSARQAVLSAQTRLKSADSKSGLGKLKLQGLELEKKTLLLDRQDRSGSALDILKQSILSLKDRVMSQKTQIEFIRQKISEMMRIDRPYLKDVRQHSADNAQLKNELGRLSAERESLLGQVDSAIEKRNSDATLPDMKRAQELIARKQSLDARIAQATVRKQELTAQSEARAANSESLVRQIREIEAENKKIEDAMGNVRENIAVLEYRINTVTRYKNRNTAKK